MNPWVRTLGLLGVVVFAAVLLRALPPALVLLLVVGGIVYANHVLTVRPARQHPTTAELLGLQAMSEERAGLSSLPFALLERPTARTLDVMVGTWRGTEVRLFDVETTHPSATAGGTPAVRRFSCALTRLPFPSPHLVVEPGAFLTSPEDRPGLPVCSVSSEHVATAFDVRCEDPSFGTAFLDGAVAAWLVARQDVAFEMQGSAVLLYRMWIPEKDRDLMLDTLHGFLDTVSSREE